MRIPFIVIATALYATGCHSGHEETFPRLRFASYADGKVSEYLLFDSGDYSAWSEKSSSHANGTLDEAQFSTLRASFKPEILCNEQRVDKQPKYETNLLLANGMRCGGQWESPPVASADTEHALTELMQALAAALGQ